MLVKVLKFSKERFVTIIKKSKTISWLLFILSVLLVIAEPSRGASKNVSDDICINYKSFDNAIKINQDEEAYNIGNAIIEQLKSQYGSHIGFSGYISKLTAAEFLAREMVAQLQKATRDELRHAADELFVKSNQQQEHLNLPGAKQYYDTSRAIFSRAIRIDELSDNEKNFLANYYNVKLRAFTSEIAKAGQVLAIAQPQFKDTYNYALVLPLLHVRDGQGINIEVLPLWMQRSDQLTILSDACLLHFGKPFQAMELSRQWAHLYNKEFSPAEYYRDAADKSASTLPNIVVECLKKAIELVGDDEAIIALKFEITQHWWNAGNYILAAGQAKNIIETYPDCKDYAKAVNMYYYALSRSNNSDSILVDIDTAIDNPRCSDYKAKLMYIKWWALRRNRDQDAVLAAVEHKILNSYGDNPMVATIILAQATDLLAHQQYTDALELLNHINEKFPGSKAAKQAKKMQAKLQLMQKSEGK